MDLKKEEEHYKEPLVLKIILWYCIVLFNQQPKAGAH
jgi:hypothetical protein